MAAGGGVVASHAADSGYGSTSAAGASRPLHRAQDVDARRGALHPHRAAGVRHDGRGRCHGVFDRHPKLRVGASSSARRGCPSSCAGSVAYGKTPQLFAPDPVESFREHVWVAPFYEDYIARIRDVIGADRILLGSDWPHPEGLPSPRSALRDDAALTPDELRLALHDNLALLSAR